MAKVDECIPSILSDTPGIRFSAPVTNLLRVLARTSRHRLRGSRAGRTGPLGLPSRLRAIDGTTEGGAPLGLLRGTADRQRHPRSPPRLGAGLQGPLLSFPDDGRLVRGTTCRL